MNTKYKFYINIIGFIDPELKRKFPNEKPKEGLENEPANLLWMMEKLQTFNDIAKRGRWIGWILAHAEMLGILTNEKSRELSRKDSEGGFV